jgi:hypothetical protein
MALSRVKGLRTAGAVKASPAPARQDHSAARIRDIKRAQEFKNKEKHLPHFTWKKA